jgi:hypothetical protein
MMSSVALRTASGTSLDMKTPPCGGIISTIKIDPCRFYEDGG